MIHWTSRGYRISPARGRGAGLLPSWAALALGGVVALLGCGPLDDDPTTSAGNVVLLDANNYSSVTSLDGIPPATPTAPGDIQVCWAGVTQDMRCHDVEPVAGVKALTLLRFRDRDEAAIKADLVSGAVSSRTVDAFMQFHTADAPGQTCMSFSQLSVFGSPVDVTTEYVDDAAFTFLLLISSSEAVGVGTLGMMFLDPTTGSGVTSVDFAPPCGILDFSATLTTAAPVSIPAAGPWVLDWSGITHDAQGHELNLSTIDGLLVGFYEGMTLEQVQAQVIDYDIIATRMWQMDLETTQRTADIAGATERTADGSAGAPFPGFDAAATGVWLVGLTCSTCQSPAPVVVGVLTPTP